tara:strand:- start:227 stop:427 length:201 start_codon:yes stop_codon:yes gene_type:complete
LPFGLPSFPVDLLALKQQGKPITKRLKASKRVRKSQKTTVFSKQFEGSLVETIVSGYKQNTKCTRW